MVTEFRDVVLVAQAIAGIATPVALILALRQFRLVRQQARKQSDIAATNFVLQAEGQFDRPMESLIGAPPGTIRIAYAAEINPDWSDDELRAFMFMKRLFGHISRMIFILHNPKIDIGLSDVDRQNLIADWDNTLRKYRDHPTMRHIYFNAVRNQDYNSHMLALCGRVFETGATDEPAAADEAAARRQQP